MTKPLIVTLVGSGLLIFGLNAGAQTPREDQGYGHSEFASAQGLFRQVRSDIDRAERNAYGDYSEDRSRFARARGELSELQRQWDESEYSPSQVDNVIVALQRVMDDNDLGYRDRDVLASDLRQLRDFRSSHGY